MAMTRQLFSINGLATELGRDRRTVSAALASVSPDGKTSDGKYAAWYLQTAIDALAPRRSGGAGGEFWSSHLIDRVETPSLWGNAHKAHCSGEEFAKASNKDLDTVLVWLKAGMPFVLPGDWQTGAGFTLSFPWSLDWMVAAERVMREQGDQNGLRTLGFS